MSLERIKFVNTSATKQPRPKSPFHEFFVEELNKQRTQNPRLENTEYMKLSSKARNDYKKTDTYAIAYSEYQKSMNNPISPHP
jgi:hypothetical protein